MTNKLTKKPDFTELHNKVRGHADSYANKKDLKLDHNRPMSDVNEGRAKKIAEAYHDMPHNPNDPDTKKAYGALIKETADQYNHVRKNGVKFSPIKQGQEDPYSSGSHSLFNDLHSNNHMWYFPTDSGFGNDSSDDKSDHPLMSTVDTIDGPMKANDVFRAVHDYFGHAKEGHQFGPKGEESAWKAHMQMYSPDAQRALTSETRGQNSWVNFGPHGEQNRANPKNTIFAEQKAGLLPDWAMESDTMKKSEDKYHPVTHGEHHFIFSPENPRVEPKLKMSPEEVLAHVRSLGETAEDTHGRYGNIERSIIVHDPKNVDKLHNLASGLGQESAIHSKDGAHEMHYYHGPNAGKIRHGNGTKIYDEKPDDNYTKITDHTGQSKFFAHNFDQDNQNLKQKITKREFGDNILSVLSDKLLEKNKLTKYWGFILGDKIEKSLSIRTEGRVFVSMDGDNIGASVERAAMADDLETIISQSNTIMAGQKLIRQWAHSNNADIYIDGGDDIAFTLPVSKIKNLEEVRRAYREETGFTVTIGVGDTISHAGHAMLFGKLKGKNQINEWSPEIDAELQQISVRLTPEQKMVDHGLIKEARKESDIISGGLADRKDARDFNQKKLKQGKEVESEHTNSDDIAEEIAMDHLTEDVNYYNKLKDLEKAIAPPTRPGEESEDGRYVSKHNKPAGMVAWHYNQDLSDKYDAHIDQNKDTFLSKFPDEHKKVVSDLVDSVRNDFHRHFVIARDGKNSPEKIRARHIKGLMEGNSNYSIKVHDPDNLTLTAHDRHGNTSKSSTWHFSTKNTQGNALGADKGVKTSTGGRYVSKSESTVSSTGWSRNKPLENDQGAILSLSEILQHRRYNGISRRSSSLIKSSQDQSKQRLVHYSTTAGLDSIDPNHMGSGVGSKGLESKYGKPEVERSYFYREGTDPESVVTSGSKSRYTSELDPHHSIYDIGTDPDNLHQELKQSGKTVNPGIVTSDELLNHIKSKGHYGFTNSKSHLPNAVALFYKHPAKEDSSYNKSEIKMIDEDFDLEGIEKSKNVREQRKKVFGTSHQPAKGSTQREKQLQHVQDKFNKRYNVPTRKTPGKLNSNGKMIDKPDWKTGNLEYQDNVDAAIHEGGHFEQIPEGRTMEDHQKYMDGRFGEINKEYGYLKGKQTQDEIQPQAAENPIRRRLGLPATRIEAKVPDGTLRGRDYQEGDEIPLSVDTKEPMAVKGKRPNGKDVFLRRQSRLLSPENKERTDKIDNGELVYDKDRGWVEGTSINARINRKVRMGAQEYFKSKLSQLKAKESLQDNEEPLASSVEAKIENLKHKYIGTGETEQESIDRRTNQIKRQFRDKQEDPSKDPMKQNMKHASKKINKDENTLDYAKMNQPRQHLRASASSPTLNYADMNKPQPQPEPHTLDYSKMKVPDMAAKSREQEVKDVKRRKSHEALRSIGRKNGLGDMGSPAPIEDAKSKALGYFKSKLK